MSAKHEERPHAEKGRTLNITANGHQADPVIRIMRMRDHPQIGS